MSQYITTDPNMSEGRDERVIEAIVDELRGRDGVRVMGYDPDPDFGRLPVGVIGRPAELREALLDMCGKAYELIDMEKHSGKHPQIGAVDQIECYPAHNITAEEVREFCEDLGQEIHSRYGVPIYFDGLNARRPENVGMTFIRKGNYKGLKEAVGKDPRRNPDLGPAKLHPTAGATIVGALERQDAYYNVMLDSTDLELARKLADYVRGRTGGFAQIQGAIGLNQLHRPSGRNLVCVSCEITDPLRTPLHRVFDLIRSEARRYGVNVVSSQICGNVSAELLSRTAEWYLQLENVSGPWDYDAQVLEKVILDLEAESAGAGA